MVAILGLPLIALPEKFSYVVGRVWGKGCMLGLKFICDIEYDIRGGEFIPQNNPCVIAAKHQSTLDVLCFFSILDNPVYILKKELVRIPLYGFYLLKMGMIVIDRKAGAKALRSMIRDTCDKLRENRSVIIFPEGTRTKINQEVKYNPGIGALYTQSNVPIIPVALNTGLFWPKGSFLKKPGKVVIEFLQPIHPGLNREEFMSELYNQIESNSKRLICA